MVRVFEEKLTDLGVEVVICSKSEGSREKVSYGLVERVFGRGIFFLWRAAKRAKTERVEVIHFLCSASSFVGLKTFIISHLSGIPVLLHITGLLNQIVGCRLLLRAKKVIVGGSYLMEFFPDSIEVPPLSPHINSQSGEQVRQTGCDKSPRRILYLGALEPQRGVDTLVDAIVNLRSHFGLEDVIVTIAWNGLGDTNYVREIRKKVEANRLQGSFHWERTVRDVSALYRNHDLVVIPRASRARMGFPLRLLEAISYGRPVIVSEVGEMPRVLDGCGLVFPCGDVQGLAQALAHLLTDWAFYQECAMNCHQKALEYDALRIVGNVVELYRELSHGSQRIL